MQQEIRSRVVVKYGRVKCSRRSDREVGIVVKYGHVKCGL